MTKDRDFMRLLDEQGPHPRRDHWSGEPLDWQLNRTYDNKEAAAVKGAHKEQYAMLPTIDYRTNKPEADFVICAWRTNDAKHDMTPEELLTFRRAFIAHSPNWWSDE